MGISYESDRPNRSYYMTNVQCSGINKTKFMIIMLGAMSKG